MTRLRIAIIGIMFSLPIFAAGKINTNALKQALDILDQAYIFYQESKTVKATKELNRAKALVSRTIKPGIIYRMPEGCFFNYGIMGELVFNAECYAFHRPNDDRADYKESGVRFYIAGRKNLEELEECRADFLCTGEFKLHRLLNESFYAIHYGEIASYTLYIEFVKIRKLKSPQSDQ